jgi:CelD/BcsL family acetyltransferase involved in cellulose biosynthesis
VLEWRDYGPDYSFDAIRHEWDHLLEASWATPFQTREWLTSWAEATRQPLHLWTYWLGHHLVGLWPHVVSTRWLTTMRTAGTGPSDYQHPLIHGGAQETVSAQLASHWHGVAESCLIDLPQIRNGVLTVEPGTAWPQAGCPIVPLPSTFDEFLKSLGKSLRQDVNEGQGSRLAKRRLTLRQTSSADWRQGWEILLDLHGRRWKKRWMPGAFGTRQTRALHERWLSRAVPKGYATIYWLEQDGRPVGAIYTMRMNGQLFFYQSGIEPDLKGFSPGSILLGEAVRQAIEEGCTVLDMMRGLEGYKMRWKPSRIEANSRYVIAHGLEGRASRAIQRARFSVEQYLRRTIGKEGVVTQ